MLDNDLIDFLIELVSEAGIDIREKLEIIKDLKNERITNV